MKIALITVGCKLNKYETVAMAEMLKRKGFHIVRFPKTADIYIINSCAVTKKAEIDTLRFIRKSKESNPLSKIILTGCCSKFINKKDIINVDLLLNNNEKTKIVDYIKQLENGNVKISSDKNNSFFPILNRFANYSRAFIKIQDGCNCSCSYCIVPCARGESKSESPDKIIEQVNRFISNGYKEIVLTGVNIGVYGQDIIKKINLAYLLKNIISIPGLGRIRLSSIEPQEFNPELIEVVTDSKICPHFHIPLQSGDDMILKAMNRKYQKNDYLKLTENLFKKIPDSNLGTDVIVGFPGESNDHFNNTYKFIETNPFSYIHIFRYSPRPNTSAETMADQVQEKTKKERAEKLAILNQNKKSMYAKNFLNKTVPVFIENRMDKETKRWIGLSHNYLRIFVAGPESIKRNIVMAKITEVDEKILAEVV